MSANRRYAVGLLVIAFLIIGLGIWFGPPPDEEPPGPSVSCYVDSDATVCFVRGDVEFEFVDEPPDIETRTNASKAIHVRENPRP